MTKPDTQPRVLFAERGASWAWVLAGPASAGAMALIQLSTGYGLQPLVPSIFLVLVSGFLAVQVKAARMHTSVVLTPEWLRQGMESINTAEIVRILPPASGSEVPAWQSSRALGELTGVPRGRTGIGLKLTGGRSAQAWARRHPDLRAALTELLDGRDR